MSNQRALAHIEKVTNIRPILGADNIEQCNVLGWNLITKKGEFHDGDKCVYIEIDSKCPEIPEFEFLRSKDFKVKTMKLGKFNCISQGLALPVSTFPKLALMPEGTDVTNDLGITYYVTEDNVRKANNVDKMKYQSMMDRRKKLFSNKFIKRCMKYGWFRKIMFFFFGKKADKPLSFPNKFDFVTKTDETRCENIPSVLLNKEPLIKTLKVDGSSVTYVLERKPFGKYEYYVCSRNVRQADEQQRNYHSDYTGDNVYWAMEHKYHICEFLKDYIKKNNLQYACLQGEIAGPSIQGNPHKLATQQFYAFNLIRSDVGRVNSVVGQGICRNAGINWVPIIDTRYILPDTMEELKLEADGPCEIGSGLREGYVYRNYDNTLSFKNVSRKYLLKHS